MFEYIILAEVVAYYYCSIKGLWSIECWDDTGMPISCYLMQIALRVCFPEVTKANYLLKRIGGY